MEKQHWVNLNGRDYPLYSGVLDAAHKLEVESILVSIIQLPSADNEYTAICRAEVTLAGGRTFADIGDANPKNTNSRIATALLRMASTRAKGRALRDATNIGQTLFEELPDLDESAARGSGLRTGTGPQSADSSAIGDSNREVRTGHEPTWRHPDTGVEVSRADLLRGHARLQQLAQEKGRSQAPTVNPQELSNDALFAMGVMLRELLNGQGPKEQA